MKMLAALMLARVLSREYIPATAAVMSSWVLMRTVSPAQWPFGGFRVQSSDAVSVIAIVLDLLSAGQSAGRLLLARRGASPQDERQGCSWDHQMRRVSGQNTSPTTPQRHMSCLLFALPPPGGRSH